MIKLILLACSFTLSFYVSEAKYVQQCILKCRTSDGIVKEQRAEVTFLTGDEMNKSGFGAYTPSGVYAVINMDQFKPVVITISTFLLCGEKVNKDCIINAFTDLKGKDGDGNQWQICLSDFCM